MLLAMLLAMLVTVAMGAAGHGANHLEVAAPPPMLSPERLAGVGHRTRAAFINNITLKLRHADPCTARRDAGRVQNRKAQHLLRLALVRPWTPSLYEHTAYSDGEA